MNKAFIREPEFDGNAYCPRCGSLGTAVTEAALDRHVQEEFRSRIGQSAWFCPFARCDAAYFDLLERMVTVGELRHSIYPKDPFAPICPCFGFTMEDIQADLQEGAPTRIRALLAKTKSPEARCGELAADGRCCMPEVQRLYMRGISKGE